MNDDYDDTGVYYFKGTKMLLIGMPKSNILCVQNPDMVAHIPLQEIFKTAQLNIRDVESLAFTTIDNFHAITRREEDVSNVWEEFQEYLKEKKRRENDNILKFDLKDKEK